MQRRDKQLFETNLRRLIRSEIRSLHEAEQKTDEKTPPVGGPQDPVEKDDANTIVNKIKSAFASAGITLEADELKAIAMKLIDDKNKPNTTVDFRIANVFEKILMSDSPPAEVGAAVTRVVAIAQKLKLKK